MPNYIKNKLIISTNNGDINAINEFVNTIKGNNRNEVIDFNIIIPMPECIKNTESSSRTNDAVLYYCIKNNKELAKPNYYFSYELFISNKTENELKEFEQIGERYYNNYLSTGFFDWYDWSLHNWGTKWNAYNSKIESQENNTLVITFDTAWVGVTELISKLVQMFPQLDFIYKYADEDYYNNCGYAEGNAKEFNIMCIPDQSNQSKKIYNDCWGLDVEEDIDM